MEFVKVVPTKEGWYWMQYQNKRKSTTTCPCYVTFFEEGKGTIVRSFFNDTWFAGPSHGGKQLRYDGKIDKSIRFGDEIKGPE